MNSNKTFRESGVYEMTFVGDSQLRPRFICTKRTKSMATFKRLNTKQEEVIKRRVKVGSDGSEYVLDGSYSMSPQIKASNCVG